MGKKILNAIIKAALMTIVISFSITVGVLYNYFEGVQGQQLRDELQLAMVAVENMGVDYLKSVKDGPRMTWIAKDGNVIYDTDVEASHLENHQDREEFKEALQIGKGHATRYSDTLFSRYIYESVRLEDGSVLRLAKEEATVGVLAFGMIQPILVIGLLTLLVSWYFAKRLSQKIVEPLNHLDVEHPLENDTYEELTPLLNRIYNQQLQIKAQAKAMRKNEDEYNQIMASMTEGLMVLDPKHKIISMNEAAKHIFNSDEQVIGQDFLVVERRTEMIQSLKEAFNDGHAVIKLKKDGKVYQYVFSRIESNGKTIGMVVLAFDITNKENIEKLRREFSANVSHELKTPLQGIIGSADLLRNGLVKAEDQTRFIDHIHEEATRLVNLVNDIMRLSQLDEANPMEYETFDVKDVLNSVVLNYPNTVVLGDGVEMYSSKQLVYEIIRNLIDNAHKYSGENEKVRVQLMHDDHQLTLQVMDQGIGIEKKDLDRIFERFYRVDQSHSKQIGGTGLGLSIVKHAVMTLKGDIQVESQLGEGSTFTVVLPIKAE